MAFEDKTGLPLRGGDRVCLRTHGHRGGPSCADLGVVVGFARVNVLVEWAAIIYGPGDRPHSIPGDHLMARPPLTVHRVTRLDQERQEDAAAYVRFRTARLAER